MVNTNDLPQINSLMQQYTNYREAADIIDSGGTIATFTVMWNGKAAAVAGEGITYPPAMLQTIRDQVQARADDLKSQLAALGVTL